MNRMPARVARRVEKAGDCLLWTGGRNGKGYGSIGVSNKKTALVHRFVYEAQVGPIPDDMTIDHLCCTKTCVNVEHMEVVTRAENSIRAAKNRARIRKVAQPASKPETPRGRSPRRIQKEGSQNAEHQFTKESPGGHVARPGADRNVASGDHRVPVVR